MGKRPAGDGLGDPELCGAGDAKSARVDSTMDGDASSSAVCPLCQGAYGKFWPHVRGRLLPVSGGELLARCHVECAFDIIEGRGCKNNSEISLEPSFKEEMRRIFRTTLQVFGRQPALRMCFEELRLAEAVRCWPPADFPAPPPATFNIDNITEIRISSCPSLRSLPAEVGLCHSMKALVLISNRLETIPKEVGLLHQLDQLFLNGNFLRSLPKEVGELPALEELCLDSNLLTVVPPFTSPKLTLFTAPANKLVDLPALSGPIERLEAHGNALRMVVPSSSPGQWGKMRNLKLMGNKLSELPEELEQMWSLRTLLVSGNQLKTLPACIARFGCLEWIFAYNNVITELPAGMLKCCKWLDRVLLEGNPLSGPTMEALLEDAAHCDVKVLSLDLAQVRAHAAGAANWSDLPPCVSVGSLVHSPECSQYYMKLVRASQLRRQPGMRAIGEPGGPQDPLSSPAELLVVAFAASQGEPEWLGVLRRLGLAGKVTQLPPEDCPIAAEVGELTAPAAMAALWSHCERGVDGEAVKRPACPDDSAALEDFDVLSVIDGRMQWYAEDAAAFTSALGKVAAQHKRTLFVGASMGGFGAMLHSARLADAVVAFSPQSRLDHATLRPPACDLQGLEDLSKKVRDSVATARARGACVDVHCAADEHCWHGLSLPLGDLRLTVHPLLPRKPFARLLDRAQMLEPILADAICRLLRAPLPRAAPQAAAQGGACDAAGADVEPQVVVARWWHGGGFSRHPASRQEVLQLLFGPGEPVMPRPGDWFCPRCHRRNVSSQFFCTFCPRSEGSGKIVDVGVRKIPGGRDYPRIGDWGCGKCGAALCGYDKACGMCWSTRDHEFAVVVA